ncbi:NACHT domain-containing protein [Brevibacterium casei]|uniref:NACHT domain-containing protein n=1 Tax=Brevibacterium casei TaxID=33889 RepID=UPI0019181807|nr:NACHT domain-containing protein [Brevibacterium casei]QQT68337.1 NACHT domain-containing protein [Brevibacterium casei]
MTSYREDFASRRGRVNLPLLADDLEPVIVEDLYSSIKVIDVSHAEDRRNEEYLPRLLRRRRRILLVGQPGSGKSVATWEIAASCAEDCDAPIPVRVHLPDLLPIVRSRDLALSDIIEAGVRHTQGTMRPSLISGLNEAAVTGDLMLLLDGLDECRTEAATMAEHLRRLIGKLHPKTGLVLATRASAEVPAERLGLGRLDLVRPADLDSTMDAVLVECARVRVPDAQREGWLAARRSWIRDVQTAQRGLVDAPQLALLVVLIVAESVDMDVPRERAELLHAAVVRSVQRWELTRFKGPGLEWAGDLTPNMLLDGFQILGQLLDTDDTCDRADAISAIMMVLSSDRWGIAQGRAEELATQVLKFWDEHVSVFTLDETGTLTTRSRVFTEVATAMWTKTCSAEELETWATSALGFRDSEGVLGLAQGLNPLLVQILLVMGSENPEAPLAVASATASGTISPTPDDLQLLSAQLMKHITAIDAGELRLTDRRPRRQDSVASLFGDRRGGKSWPLVEALCGLPLHDPAREERRAFVDDLPGEPPDKTVLNAWIVLVDADNDDRELTESEVGTVQAALDLDIPDLDPPIYTSRRSIKLPSGPPVPQGIGSVALHAVRHLAQLSVTAPEQIYRISVRVSGGEHDAIERALRNAGVDISPWQDYSAFAGLISALNDDDHELRFLELIAGLDTSRGSAALDKSEKWSLKDAGDLIFASGYLSVGVRDFRAAFLIDSLKLRSDWLACVACAHQVDVAAAAAQARYIIDANRYEDDWPILIARPAYKRGAIRTNALGPDEQVKLLGALEAVSNWIAWSAANILAQTAPHWDTDELFDLDKSKWKPRRALLFPLVAILASEDGERLAQKAANSDDPAFRQAAAFAIAANAALDPRGDIARILSIDEDLTVRGSLDAGDPPPLRWSCNDCGAVNDIEVVDCPGCEEGTRPNREKASKKRR